MPPDALDLLRAFSAREVRYLVVGAHALAVWAAPRATGDFDLFVDPTPANAARVWAALEEFGAPLDELRPEDLATPGVVFQMGEPPYRIDLNTELTALGFDEAWAGRTEIELEGLTIPILGRAEMVRNMRATRRPKDLADLALLGEPLDRQL